MLSPTEIRNLEAVAGRQVNLRRMYNARLRRQIRGGKKDIERDRQVDRQTENKRNVPIRIKFDENNGDKIEKQMKEYIKEDIINYLQGEEDIYELLCKRSTELWERKNQASIKIRIKGEKASVFTNPGIRDLFDDTDLVRQEIQEIVLDVLNGDDEDGTTPSVAARLQNLCTIM